MTTQVTDRSWNEGVLRQFPWIEQFSVDRFTSRIKISKVSNELLEVVPSEEYGTNASGYYTHDCVQFHDDNGVVLGEVSPRTRHSDANDMSSDSDGETIGDRWYHLEQPTLVKYITRQTRYSGGYLSHDPDTYDLEIFKVADFDIRWWMSQRDKASDQAVMSTGLGPDETHDGETIKRLHVTVDELYRQFALEEVRHSEYSRTPCPAMEDNPWTAFATACYQFLERDNRLLTKYGSGTEVGSELLRWAQEQAKEDSGILWDLNRWQEDVHPGDKGTEKVTGTRTSALRSLISKKEIYDIQKSRS